ncbi:MAG: virulence factor family protein [Candidatus Binatus sp.]
MTGLRRALAAIAVVYCIGGSPAYALDAGRLGTVKIVEPQGPIRGVVILFSGREKWSRVDEAAAQEIAKGGALVAEVDSREYLNRLDKINEKCHELVYDAEWLSRDFQRTRKFPRYLTPIVAGVGEGGTIAELILDQAPAVTIAGAVALDPAETIESRRPICSDVSVMARRGRRFRYGAPKKLPGFWTIGLTPRVNKADRAYVMHLRREGAPFELHEIAANVAAGEALRSMIEPHLAKLHPTAANAPTTKVDISELPIAELPVAHPSKLMAVVLSGDGGWRDLDKTIAEDLQRQGVPVVGLDSLRYFWSRKTPDQTASVVAALIRTFMARWRTDEVALIGYSFGADVMPFAYNRLPEDLRAHVALIALLALSRTADFQITIRGWLGEPPGPDAIAVLPEADKIPPRLMQCFYGHDESDSACPALASRGVEAYGRSGGHHFDGDYGAIAKLILARFKDRTELSSSRRASH